jgi:hypothetical protein
MQDETVWLTQQQLAELYQTTKQNISLHINNIYKEGKLQLEATVKEYLTVREEGTRKVSRSLEYYNLDRIISIGYRVISQITTRFRIWAIQRLKEYLIKRIKNVTCLIRRSFVTKLMTLLYKKLHW